MCNLLCFFGGEKGGVIPMLLKSLKLKKKSCMYVLGIKGEMYDLR